MCRFVDLKLARELCKWFKVQELARQVAHEQGFFGSLARRGLCVPRGETPLSSGHLASIQRALHGHGAASVLARVACPLRAHKKPDHVVLNLETQNLATLVHERWLDNFALDFLFAVNNRESLRRGHVFLPTILQSLFEIQSEADVRELAECVVEACRRAQGKRSASEVSVRACYVPWLRSQSHWCLGIIAFSRSRLEGFDSLQLSPLSSMQRAMQRFCVELRRRAPGLPRVATGSVVNRSREWNGGDPQGTVNGRSVITSGSCGSCAVRAAETLAAGNSLAWGYADMPYWRLRQMLAMLPFAGNDP
jgi:hypothetical protein